MSHDGDPVAYRFSENDDGAVITDLGYDDYIVDNLLELDSVLIEANHDADAAIGPYPYHLKQRIWGNRTFI